MLKNYNYFNLINEYNEILNEKKEEYSSIYINFDNNIRILKELNIDYNKILKITLQKGPDFKTDDNIIFETLFSLDNIKNNLISLKILFRWNEVEFSKFLGRPLSKKVNSNLFEKINEFKELKYLYLSYVNFDKNVKIKIRNLKILIVNCENLSLSDIICPKLEILYYCNNNQEPKLEDINLENLKELKELYINSKKKVLKSV